MLINVMYDLAYFSPFLATFFGDQIHAQADKPRYVCLSTAGESSGVGGQLAD